MSNLRMDLTEEGRRVVELKNAPSPSCYKCTHMIVCNIFRATAGYLANAYPEGTTSPLKADDLAKVCNAYTLPGPEGE